MSDLRDMCPDCQRPYSMHGHGGEGENAYPVCPPDLRDELAARRAWTTEHHRAALQLITEIERGLTVADMEVRRARFTDARHTIAALRGLLPPLERLVQRRPRQEDLRAHGGES